jgi:dihydroorotase-like cyclic amidohydrolase
MTDYDLVIRDGTVVLPGRQEIADVGVDGGRIVKLGGAMRGRREIDGYGLLVLPGGIDAHVHLMTPGLTAAVAEAEPGEPVWVDDFWSGSRAALAGGITTIGNMTFAADGESMTDAVAREMADAGAEAAADWFLHPVLTGLGGTTEAEIAALAAAGHTSVKVFLSNPDLAAGTPGLAEAVAAAGRAGSLTLLHCEDGAALRQTGQELIGAGHGAVRYFPDARTVSAEVAAVSQAIDLARRTGAPVYIVHLSSAAALAECAQARAAGLPVYVETRPLYLHLTRERFAEPDGAKYVGAPPLREQADRDALWQDAGGQAGPGAGRADRAAGRGRPGDADADAVLRGSGGRADHGGPVRGADLVERGTVVRAVPAQGGHRDRLRRRPGAVGPAGGTGHRRGVDAVAGGLLGVRRVDRAGLAQVRDPARPGGAGQRGAEGGARAGPVGAARAHQATGRDRAARPAPGEPGPVGAAGSGQRVVRPAPGGSVLARRPTHNR